MFVAGLIPLLVLGLIVWGIVALVRRSREGEEETDPGIGTVRRLFIYGFALLGVVLSAWGLSLLVAGLLDAVASGADVIAEEDTGVALGIALTVVGVPVWAAFWLAGQRSLRRHPVEQRSQLRRAYFALVRAAALATVMANGFQALEWVFGVAEFDGQPWGWLLVWGGVWLLHQRLVAAEAALSYETRLLDRVYLYFGAVVGLGAIASGLGGVIAQALFAAYEALFLEEAVGDLDPRWENLRSAFALALVGGAAWYWHWIRQARHDARTTLWHVYLFLWGILGGVVVAVVGSAFALFAALEWALDASDGSAAEHFEDLPAAFAAVIIGVAGWGYHRLVQREHGAIGGISEPERVYRYLVAAAGLVTLAGGLTALLVLGIEGLTPEADVLRESGWWRSPLAAVLTLIAIGAPLWLYYWFGLQRAIATGDRHARAALSRRVFIFGVFGVAGLVALTDLVFVLFRLLEATLEGALRQDTVFDVRWSIAIVLSAGAVSAYYWLVLREDQRAIAALSPAPAEPRTGRTQVVLLAGANGATIAAELERRGVQVRQWRRTDEAAPAAPIEAAQVAALCERVATVEGEHILVVVHGDGDAEVLPYAP